jgi:hypothetical protein
VTWRGQKGQHGTRVYKVKFCFWKRLREDIVTPDLKVWRLDLVDKEGLKISCDDVAIRPNPMAEPLGDGTSPRSYF